VSNFEEFDGTFSKVYGESWWQKTIKKVLKIPKDIANTIKKAASDPDKVSKEVLKEATNLTEKSLKNAVDAAQSFVFDTKAGRYAYRSLRRFIPTKVIDTLNEFNKESAKKESDRLATDLRAGKIDLNTWQRKMRGLIKSQHLKVALIAKGGIAGLSPKDMLSISKTLKKEFRYLRAFSKDIKAGKVSEKQLKTRSKMYIEKTKIAKAQMDHTLALNNGKTLMERILDRGGNSCVECRQYAAAGVRPIGELPLPTEKCSCRSYCRCKVKYYFTN